MAGAQTSLSLQDQLSGPLMKMMKAMDNTIRVMENMDSAASNIDTRGLANARRSIDNASADMARLAAAAGATGNEADRAASQQQNFNDSISGGLPGIAKLASGLLGAVGAYKALGAAKSFLGDLFSQGIDFHAFKQGSEVAFTTFLGDAELAQSYMDDMLAFAKTTPFAYPDLLESSRNLIAFGIEAENTFPIMQSIGDAVAAIGGGNAELQNMADIFGMIQVQGKLSMMEVNRLGKNGINAIGMLAEAAGVTSTEMRKQISDGAIGSGQAITTLVAGMDKQFGGLMAGVKGTWIGSIDSMKSAARNAGADMMEKLMVAEGPLVKLVDGVTGLFKKIPTYIGPAVAAFTPLIAMLGVALDEGRFNGFFALIGGGFTAIAWLVSGIAMGFIWLTSVVDEFWPVIAVGLAVLTTVLFPAIMMYLNTMVVKLWLMIQPVLAQAAAWALIHWPILLIIGVVIALIAILMHFGVSTEQILGFVGGLFFALGALIWNTVASMWNIFAMFAEFLVNLFIDPTYAMKKLIYDMSKHAIDNMAAMAGSFDKAADILGKTFVAGANIAIGGVNMLIKALNKIPGVKIEEVGKLSAGTGDIISNGLKNMANNLEAPTSTKNVKSIARMDLKSIPGAYNSGYSKGSNLKMPSLAGPGVGELPNMELGNMLDGLASAGGKSKNPTGGKLDKVGKIDDEISIADEDLKMLRDLAEIKSVQNFVTLTPSVNLGGVTVHEEVDLDKVMKKIATTFEEDMARSAEGVYT